MKPWEIIRKRFFGGKAPDPAAFCKKYKNLDEASVRRVFSGDVATFSPELCAALSYETKMSKQFFLNMSERYQQRTAA
jgi:hypothetical protein